MSYFVEGLLRALISKASIGTIFDTDVRVLTAESLFSSIGLHQNENMPISTFFAILLLHDEDKVTLTSLFSLHTEYLQRENILLVTGYQVTFPGTNIAYNIYNIYLSI